MSATKTQLDARRAAGICLFGSCRLPTLPNRRMCAAHTAHTNTYQRLRRHARPARSCRSCHAPLPDDYRRLACVDCLRKQSEYDRKLRATRLKQGLCVECGKANDGNRQSCSVCRARRAVWRKKACTS